jgi:hypothetical protein
MAKENSWARDIDIYEKDHFPPRFFKMKTMLPQVSNLFSFHSFIFSSIIKKKLTNGLIFLVLIDKM